MMDKQLIIGDKMVENQLKENSDRLNISIEELIDRYIRRGLYTDDYYKQPKLSKEKLEEIFNVDWKFKNNQEKSVKMHDFDSLIGIYNHCKK